MAYAVRRRIGSVVASALIGFRRAILLSSVLTGVLFGIVYCPFTVYFFPWSFSLQPLIFLPIAGSVVWDASRE